MIDNPEAIRFVNEVIRPLCERARAFKVEVDAATTTWFAGLNAVLKNDGAEPVDDKREREGVSRLTGADINNVMGQLIGLSSALNSEIIAKPCVRALEVK